eukprot:6195464-Pleurochrysis_carterae.AAC.1
MQNRLSGTFVACVLSSASRNEQQCECMCHLQSPRYLDGMTLGPLSEHRIRLHENLTLLSNAKTKTAVASREPKQRWLDAGGAAFPTEVQLWITRPRNNSQPRAARPAVRLLFDQGEPPPKRSRWHGKRCRRAGEEIPHPPSIDLCPPTALLAAKHSSVRYASSHGLSECLHPKSSHAARRHAQVMCAPVPS